MLLQMLERVDASVQWNLGESERRKSRIFVEAWAF
jgi:hypothetical protein